MPASLPRGTWRKNILWVHPREIARWVTSIEASELRKCPRVGTSFHGFACFQCHTFKNTLTCDIVPSPPDRYAQRFEITETPVIIQHRRQTPEYYGLFIDFAEGMMIVAHIFRRHLWSFPRPQ
jgi:hypothetical protein